MRPSKGQLEILAFNGSAELPYSAASHYLAPADEALANEMFGM